MAILNVENTDSLITKVIGKVLTYELFKNLQRESLHVTKRNKNRIHMKYLKIVT